MPIETKTYPNQKSVVIKKEPADKQHLYSIINLEALDYASIQLKSAAGFRLWIYLSKNQNNYTLALSNKAFAEWSGLGKTAYDTAVHELIDKGFLVKKQEPGNHYIFYEKPQEQKEEIIIEFPKEAVEIREQFVF